MSPGAILTLGIGIYSDISHVETLGFLAAPTPPPTPERAPQKTSAPTDYVLLSGGMFHPAYGKPKEPETVDEGEFAEMAQIVSLWKAI